MGTFEIKESSKDNYYFNLKAGNGLIVLTSEIYTSRAGCEQGIASVKANAPDPGRYDRLTASDGQHYFNLRAANGLVIGSSEMYQTTGGRNKGIASVRLNATGAETKNAW